MANTLEFKYAPKIQLSKDDTKHSLPSWVGV